MIIISYWCPNAENRKKLYDLLDAFVTKGLQMKNSYVRYRAVDFIRKYPEFKAHHLPVLQQMQKDDPNTKIVEILTDFLQ